MVGVQFRRVFIRHPMPEADKLQVARNGVGGVWFCDVVLDMFCLELSLSLNAGF